MLALLVGGCGSGRETSGLTGEFAGGVEGKVVRVTQLASSGPGSLRQALAAPFPRLIIFDVAGVIDLEGRDLEIVEPHLTLAGETAPEPGITLVRGGIRVRSHNVEISHLRIRPGDAGRRPGEDWMPDGISVEGPEGHHVRVSHCSLTWAVDENLSATGPATGKTAHHILFHDNLIAEALRASTHPKGLHSMGSLIHDHVNQVVIARNLFAHNSGRNPRFKQGVQGLIINNVIHNPGLEAIFLGPSRDAGQDVAKAEPARVSIIGNVLTPGPDSPRALALVRGRAKLHLDDNLHLRPDDTRGPIAMGDFMHERRSVEPPRELQRLPTASVLAHVLHQAGARPWVRDAIDQRVIDSVRKRAGRIIDSQDAVGGYPVVAPARRVLDVPERGRRAWLSSLVPAAHRPAALP